MWARLLVSSRMGVLCSEHMGDETMLSGGTNDVSGPDLIWTRGCRALAQWSRVCRCLVRQGCQFESGLVSGPPTFGASFLVLFLIV